MPFLPLLRPRLSLAVAFSAVAGYALAPAPLRMPVLAVVALGVLLLAGGASALNQVQERRVDALMERTRLRPVASGRLAPGRALALALTLQGCGLTLLGCGLTLLGGVSGNPALLAAAALLLYHGIYTPLKPVTPWALLPGALCGALPLLIGWTAAGEAPGDFRILLPAGLLVLWQIPHLWLIARRYPGDRQKAGFPEPLPGAAAPRLTTLWALALAAAALLLPLFAVITTPAALGVLGLATVCAVAPRDFLFQLSMPLFLGALLLGGAGL
ncbi:protoheme IX farnesyltransferase [Desulfuromonas soudanensis]|uniref:Protoheme IX farnesyltransferase n=1 Tax=Desulfuromonas soudanensis TaxID=1603606 RepID=A0A0M3QF83_9BACT|nr:UbiA family prenyltransferase [Desulfuromonas soudanensis]ALC15769.1 protoheme IX farnesyltransferase [Desulfuromonas soudanensis]